MTAQCPRCLKALKHPVHTCTPTYFVRQLEHRIQELEYVIKSHGIPVKTMTDGVAHYCTGEHE